jgi:hypothetical protein
VGIAVLLVTAIPVLSFYVDNLLGFEKLFLEVIFEIKLLNG